MNELLAKVLRWLWNKLTLLLLIVAILAVAAWVKSEFSNHKNRLRDAEQKLELMHSFERQADALESRARELNAEIQGWMDKVTSLENARTLAGDAAETAKKKLETIKDEECWYFTRWTHPTYYSKLELAEKTEKGARLAAELSDKDWTAAKNELLALPEGQEATRIRKDIDILRSQAKVLEHQADDIRNSVNKSAFHFLKTKVLEVLPASLAVLAGIILVPVGIKAFLYFLVAPLTMKARPVVLLPKTSGSFRTGPSSVSVSVELEPGDELVVHSNFLQAAATRPEKQTRWLLSWRMPLTSLASGLYMLVSVKNRGDGQTKVTVSPKDGLFDKISDISIPEASAMVVYPRSLVGIVIRNGSPPRITHHWRVANLHSWITFQFRYLVVHGEASLLLKGCRGVRAEAVSPSASGMQDQGATLGFSANLAYSGIRCETFVDYLFGRDQLFNDHFSQADGFYLTEETRHPERMNGLFGRGLEGLLDGFLKAFGI